MFSLSKRVSGIKPSATLSLAAKAQQMKNQGKDVISFGLGEPDFETPDHIKKAAIAAINNGFTRYTPVSGIMDLKEAICHKFKVDNTISYEPSQIVVSNGAKHSLYNALQAICDPGDEVIIPYPCWVSYTYMVELAGGKPVYLFTPEQDGFRIDLEKLQRLITKKTKAIMLNSPNNPTGCAYPLADLQGIAELALKNKFYLISDEIYEKLIYDGTKHYSPAAFDEKIKNLTITVNGVSKTYAMTGWRIGFAAANKEISKAMDNIQNHSTSNPNSIAQKASVSALLGPIEPIQFMINTFAQRRNIMVNELNNISHLSCRQPQGAFYVMCNISELIGKTCQGRVISGSDVFSELLLEQAHVAVTPGSAFGPENAAETDSFVRISYATGTEDILRGMTRIRDLVKTIV